MKVPICIYFIFDHFNYKITRAWDKHIKAAVCSTLEIITCKCWS